MLAHPGMPAGSDPATAEHARSAPSPMGGRPAGASLIAMAEPLRNAERKLVSAVVADLVGYTRLSETLDPEDARRLLDPYWEGAREEIERRGGTVEKFIGDAVVGLFGAPHAHEDDAARAVRAALAIAARFGQGGPRVRVGVATGLALVHVEARPEKGEALVVGDVVTTAARLQQNAPAGGVLVDDSTHTATTELVAYRRLEPVAAKGRRRPVTAWRAIRLRSAPRRRPRAARLVGRRRELGLLRAVRSRVQSDPAVSLVTVVGEPGIGKSRLVRELLHGGDRWETQVRPYGEGGPFSALAELVERQAGLAAAGGPGEATARLAAFLDERLPDRAERARVEQHVRRLIGLDSAASAEGSLESFAAWRRLLEAEAARAPLVVVMEDLHWADDALLDFVEHVVEWGARVPLLLLCTARPELLQQRPHWGGGANTLTLTLPPLSEEDTGRLLADVLGRDPTIPERAILLARAGGNPLHAEQLGRMLRETGELAEAVPETLQAVIAARLDRLAAATKQVLADASVVGPTFSAGLLLELTPRRAEELDVALHELERMDLVARLPSPGEWAFRHRLVCDVAYAELPRPIRVAKHVEAARLLESTPRAADQPELLAHHYVRAREEALAAGLPAEELGARACAALAAAAGRALSLSAFASAARLYAQALDLWPASRPGRALQLLRYASALWNAEVVGEAVALEARDALLAEGDAEGAAEAEVLLCEMRWYRGDRAAAWTHLDGAVELVAGRPPSPAKVRVLSRLARSKMLAGANGEAVEQGREALALAEQLELVELQAEALNTIGSARARGGDPQGVEDIERAIQLASGSRAAVVAYNNLSAILSEAFEDVASERAAEAGRALAEQLGDRLHLDWFAAEEIGRRLGRGEWDEARADADRWLASGGHPGYSTIGVLAVRGFFLHARGEPGAFDDLTRAVELARAAGDPQTLVPTLTELAFVLVAEGRLDEARARAEEALRCAEEAGEVPPLAAFDLAVACCATGLDGRLRPLLEQGRADSPWLRLARLYVDGRFEDALALVPEKANSWLGAFLRLRSAETGGPGLEEALAYFRSVGAGRYVARCEALADGWRNGTTPLQPDASTRSEVAGVTTVAEPRAGRGTRSR
jgi:class 3 adenylate cyclase